MSDVCTRWMRLTDRQFLGEPLSPGELEFVQAHGRECLDCKREASVLGELARTLLHVVPSEEDVQRVLLQADLEPFPGTPAPPPLPTSPRRWVAGAAALAVAAALFLLLGALGGAPKKALGLQAQQRASQPPSGVGMVTGDAVSRTAEDSCGALVEGIVLCLAAGAEVGTVELRGPRRFVELKRGRAIASLRPQPAGTSFSIRTPAGDVTAVGTVFSVELSNDGSAYARVTQGKVLVRAQTFPPQALLLAGQQLRLGDAAATALSAAELERDRALIAHWAQAISSVETHEAPAPEPAPTPEKWEGSTVVKTDAALLTSANPSQALQKARELRARGLFAPAAAVYRAVYAQAPRSEAGRTALMSLAGLQLSSLNDARGALTSYEAYLASGAGPLRLQAEYGKIRALRRLGRAQEAARLTHGFVSRYPHAPEARLLQQHQESAGAR